MQAKAARTLLERKEPPTDVREPEQERPIGPKPEPPPPPEGSGSLSPPDARPHARYVRVELPGKAERIG